MGENCRKLLREKKLKIENFHKIYEISGEILNQMAYFGQIMGNLL